MESIDIFGDGVYNFCVAKQIYFSEEENVKRLLITGFEPFGGENINPSWEVLKLLPDSINGYEITKLRIPVVFGDAAMCVIRAASELGADAVLCIGQAGGRAAITPELVAINLRHASIPDNSGAKPHDERIIECGDAAFFSTLPVRKMADAINRQGIASQVSYSAGAYVCNDVLYNLLAHFRGTKTRVGFIHVPYCAEQNKESCMDIDSIAQGLTVAIENMD